MGLECLTPLAPRYFLPLASLANVGKSVGLITHIATQPSFQKSFARHENLADIAAKSQVGCYACAPSCITPLQSAMLPSGQIAYSMPALRLLAALSAL